MIIVIAASRFPEKVGVMNERTHTINGRELLKT
ncbi:MAG: hypothetical protein QOE73_1679, partial [Verrucomicrobiota bacterium]